MDWIDTLREVVDERWSGIQRPIILSQVPRLLKERGVDIKVALDGRKLLEAVEQDGAGRIRLVRDPQQPLIYGLVPLDAEGATKEYVPAERKSIPRFNRSFWVAFIKAIDPSKRRYWDLAAKSFDDYDKTEKPPTSSIEIERKYVVSAAPGTLPDADVTYRKISEWGEAQGLSLDDFIERRAAPARDKRSIFDALGDLPDADLQRITIPLDIVRKLISKS